MYIQLTTRCNMTCAHCCFSCGKQGDDMDKETFRRAIKLAGDYGEYVTLGGGEPTLHPKFREFLIDAIAQDGIEEVCVITNGSIRRNAMLLAKLDKKGVISAELSTDDYHDPVDDDIYNAFARKRDVARHREPMGFGRAVTELGIEPEHSEDGNGLCVCSSWIVKTDGTVRQCGCEDAPAIGNVTDGTLDSPIQECHKSKEYRDALRERQELVDAEK